MAVRIDPQFMFMVPAFRAGWLAGQLGMPIEYSPYTGGLYEDDSRIQAEIVYEMARKGAIESGHALPDPSDLEACVAALQAAPAFLHDLRLTLEREDAKASAATPAAE